MRRKSSCIALDRLDEARNRCHDASELAYLPGQLFAARGRQAVIARPAVVLRLLPFRHYPVFDRSEEHTSELQSLRHLVCRLLLEKKKEYKSTRLGRVRVLTPLGSPRCTPAY